MIVLKSVIFALAVSTTVLAYPASKNEEPTINPQAEFEFVPLEAQRPGGVFPPDGVIDVDANGGGFFGNPFGGYPFPSVFDSFNALMTRMRQQLDQLLGRLPSNGGESPFPELHIPNVGDFDLGKGNTTSVTKIINGHKVTINETEYKQDGDNGGSFFKVRVVDVHPNTEGSPSKDVEGVVPVKDREPMDDEEKKIRDNEVMKPIHIETFEETDSHASPDMKRNTHWGYAKPLETLEDNSLTSELIPPPDLTNDIYVNQLLADSGAPTNPDAELFDVTGGVHQQPQKLAAPQYYPRPYGHPEVERFQIHPTFDNNIPYYPNPMIQQNRPNFPMFPPMFPPHQMYSPRQYLPEQDSASTQTHNIIQRSTTVAKETTLETAAAAPSQTDSNAST